MSVIIRLQNLAWSANALDIRQFFRGLSIPEGGVHIVGGELGDAFIAFSTDEDARQAMMMDGGKIKEMKIKLLLSSRTEMQKVIETARQQTLNMQNAFMQTPVTTASASIPTKSSPSDSPNRRDRDRDDDSSKDSSSRKNRRSDRSKSRDRSRSRDRDRKDRDRGRDRRGRRDRSRSRDRDRDRDRRDRRGRRGRDRSRSRDRTRSRDRDTKRLSDRNRDKDRIGNDEDSNNDVVFVGMTPKDNKAKGPIENGVWDVPPQAQLQAIVPALLNPALTTLNLDPTRPPIAAAAPILNQFGLNGVGNLLPNQMQPLLTNSMVPGNNMNPNGPNNDMMVGNRSGPDSWNDKVHNNDPDRFPRGRDFKFDNNGFRNNDGDNRFMNKGHNDHQDHRGRNHPHGGFQGPPNNRNNDSRPFEHKDRRENSRFDHNNKAVNNKPSQGYCVEVRNMPLSATYGDVRQCFQGLYIRNDDIRLITDTRGKPTGMAYVKFAFSEGKEQALRGKKFVRGSEVEVLHLDESIFDKTSDDSKTCCVLCSDLPSFVKEMDIANLFQDFKINDLFITSRMDNGNNQYMAYVQFARPDDAQAAQRGPLLMGGKKVKCAPIRVEIFDQAKRDRDQQMAATNNDLVGTFDCIIMRNLQYHTTDRDILDFFSDIGIVPVKIHMLLNPGSGKPAGECFCEFDTCEEALRAVSKNGLPLGKNFPSIELVSRSKMLSTLGLDVKNNEGNMMSSHNPLPELLRPPRFGGPMMHGGGGPRFPPGGNGGFPPMGRAPPLMSMPPRHMMNRHPMGGPGMGPPPPMGGPLQPPQDRVEGFGKPGCVLSLENVPFKADIDEIIEFFGNYNVLRPQVIRRYNDKGMPTGDARVAFNSPMEAQSAYRELKNCKIRDRTIFMKIV